MAVKSHTKQGFAHNKPEHEQMVETFQFVERKGDVSGAPTAAAPGDRRGAGLASPGGRCGRRPGGP